uniref:Uncharacterized protein n=1 Tax=Meloidogyne enterolobii TaxID=390850 RepID=A0A6V7VP47_MELEN|nr:unnamed protein product [Meloidogyne enterolobii]
MSKSANRLLSHLTNSSIESAPDGGSIFGHRPIRRQMSNAVYIYKHQLPNNWLAKELENVTGNKLRPVGSIIRRSSNSSRRPCKTPSIRSDLPSNPPSPPLDPSTLRQQPLSTTSSLAYPTKFRASVPAISIEKDENLHEGGREDVITFVDNKSTTAATADELMQMLMEDDGTDRPIIFTVFEAANIDGVRHLSSKSRCTRLAFMKNIFIICLSTG